MRSSMRFLLINLLLLFVALGLSGCGGSRPIVQEVTLSGGESLESTSKIFEVSTPKEAKWRSFKGYIILKNGYIRVEEERLHLRRITKGLLQEDLSLTGESLRKPSIGERLLERESNREFERYLSSRVLQDQRHFYKNSVGYVDGLKCYVNVQHYPLFESGSLKDRYYWIFCAYYDPLGEKQSLEIVYYLHHLLSREALSDKRHGKQTEKKLKALTKRARDSFEEMVNTVKIKWMDRERMQREGILYEQQRFRVWEWE